MVMSKAWATVYLTAFAAIGGCDADDADWFRQDLDQGQGQKGRDATEPPEAPAPATTSTRWSGPAPNGPALGQTDPANDRIIR
jgi:hypothetical protein